MERSTLRSIGRSGRSLADAELATSISAAGAPVTPWQVERWRQAGLIPPAVRAYEGRGRGSSAVYPEGTVERGVEVAGLIRPRRSLGEVALVLFSRGRPVPPRVVKAAYLEWLRRAEKWLGAATSPEAQFDLAEARARVLLGWSLQTKRGRRMRRRLKGGNEPADSRLLSALTNLLLVFQGAFTTDEGIIEMLEAGGLGAAIRDHVEGVGPIATEFTPDVLALVRQFNLQNLRAVIAASTDEDLVAARDVIKVVVPFASAFSTFARVLLKLPDAFGFAALADAAEDETQIAYAALALVLIKDLIQSAEGQVVIGLMSDRLWYFRQAADLLQSLPIEVARRLPSGDPAILETLDPSERDRIRSAASALLAADDFRGGLQTQLECAGEPLAMHADQAPGTLSNEPPQSA